MAERTLRRGLPRIAGGEGWPPAGTAVEVAEAVSVPAMTASPVAGSVSDGAAAPASPAGSTGAAPADGAVSLPADGAVSLPAGSGAPAAAVPSASADSVLAASVPAAAVALRRGLPRVTGGDPWPASGTVASAGAVSSAGMVPPGSVPSTGSAVEGGDTSASLATPQIATAVAPAAASPSGAPESLSADGPALRRGLPRVGGGQAWPPEGTIAAPVASASVPGTEVPDAIVVDDAAPAAPAGAPVVPAPTPSGVPLSIPLPFTRTVWPGSAPRRVAEAAPARSGPAETRARLRPTWPQAIAGLLAAAGLGILAGAAIAFVRAFLTLPFMQDFLAAFPGEYHSPFNPTPGFPAWIGWQHFFNVFLMVLIIRSGLRVRSEKRPTVFWAPRGNAKGKISLTLWFHQALDILWLVNGVVFVVLLFVSGHWARIVPTSWEVFPNALSAALQYVSFDWPTENGWVNYNSLQQLAYFTTVFIAAPLAAITGFRMSGMWPKKAERLSKAYPVEWARAVHFPVMLYFVAFIVVHVALVMLTGFLRNINHMYAAQDAVTWTGFWVFIASLAVIIGAWVAARPLVLAPIAKVFGTVSGR